MSEGYKELLTSSTTYLAVFAATGGCLIRYFEEYKHARKINIKMLLADIAVSIFLGYFSFWFCVENTDFTLSQSAILTCLVGNFGSRIFDIIRYVLFERIGLPHDIFKEVNHYDYKGNPKQQSGESKKEQGSMVRDEQRTK